MFFSEKERRVFKLLDGSGGERYLDPLRIRRVLLRETGGLLDHTWELAAQVSRLLRAGKESEITPEMLNAEEVLLLSARRAFGLPDFDPQTGGGMTDSDVWVVLNSWSRWVGKCAAGADNGRTSSAPTGSFPAGSPSAAGTPST